MIIVRALLVTSLLLPATAFADEADAEVTSYRQYTLATDAVSIGLFVAGGFAEGENGRDTDASETLFQLGAMGAFFGTPILHISRGHVGRGVGSFLLRGGAASIGGIIAVQMNRGCHQPTDQDFENFLCELDYVGYGIIGGLVVASAIDAAFMTDEPVERPTIVPQLAATPDGVRAGIAMQW